MPRRWTEPFECLLRTSPKVSPKPKQNSQVTITTLLHDFTGEILRQLQNYEAAETSKTADCHFWTFLVILKYWYSHRFIFKNEAA